MEKLRGIKTVVFDALGTLIDEHTPLEIARKELAKRGVDDAKLQQIIRIWPDKTLEYLWLRSVMGALCAPGNASEDALDYAMDVARLAGRKVRKKVRKRLLESHEDRELYGDGAPALRKLRECGYTTAILSGGAPESTYQLIKSAELEDAFDAVFSASAAGAKPDPRTYQIAVNELGLPKQEICFVSGNPWDAAGAAYFGFHVVPIVRREPYQPERLPPHPHLPSRVHKPIRSMDELACRLAGCCGDQRLRTRSLFENVERQDRRHGDVRGVYDLSDPQVHCNGCDDVRPVPPCSPWFRRCSGPSRVRHSARPGRCPSTGSSAPPLSPPPDTPCRAVPPFFP